MNIILMVIKYKHRPAGIFIIIFQTTASQIWKFTYML